MHITEANVTVMVQNMDDAIKFYEQIGLTLKQRWYNNYAMVTAPGITIGLHPGRESEIGSGSLSIGFMVDDIEEAKMLLTRNEISFEDNDGKSGHYLHFKDPDNTILYFVLPKW